MKKLILAVVLFSLISMPVYAMNIGLGVKPSVVDVYLNKGNEKTFVPVTFFNQGDTNATYFLEVSPSLKDYMYYDCAKYPEYYNEYYCNGKTYQVPKNTTKNNGIDVKILFLKKNNFDIDFEGWIDISGIPNVANYTKPIGQVGIKQQIRMRILIHQTSSPTTSTTTTTVPINMTNTTTTTIHSMIIEETNALAVTTTIPTTTTTVIAEKDKVSYMGAYILGGSGVALAGYFIISHFWQKKAFVSEKTDDKPKDDEMI